MELWAKSRLNGQEKGELLSIHTNKVLSFIETLISHKNASIILSQLSQENKLKEDVLRELFRVAAVWHDFGKVDPAFQNKKVKNPAFKTDISQYIPHNLLSPGFCNWDYILPLCKESENAHNILKIMIGIVAFHHWRESMVSYLTYDIKSLYKKINGNNINNLKAHFNNSFHKYISDTPRKRLSKMMIFPDNITFLPAKLRAAEDKAEKKLYVFLKGFLHRADHFASANLENERIENDPVSLFSIKANVIKEVGKDETELWQLSLLEKAKNKNCILEAATGMGKTEFAFLWAGDNKVFYTLPLRTSVNAMYERSKRIAGETAVSLLYSDACLYFMESIKKEGNQKEDTDYSTYNTLARELTYSVTVSTCDQLFVAGLKYPGYEKTYSTLAYSRVVIDEIQAYDPKMSAIAVKMLEEIALLGGKFLVMTATMPEFIKKEISERIKDIELIPPEAPHYPLNLRKHRIKMFPFKIKKGKSIGFEITPEGIETIAKEIIKIYKSVKKILVILNTVKQAKQMYKTLRKLNIDEKSLLLLHSQFILSERRDKEVKALNDDFEGILISTQLIEASLDINFEVLFTELSPIDSLIQRMGRVLRNKKEDGFIYSGDPNVYIFYWNNDKEVYVSGIGKERVYEKDLIKNSLVLLKDDILISEQEKSQWVNKVYSEAPKTFVEMLDRLDNLFTAQSKDEAQKIFRDIYQIKIIPRKFVDEIRDKIQGKGFWDCYKVISDYTVSIPYYRIKAQQIKEFYRIIPEVKFKGIYFANADYDEYGIGNIYDYLEADNID